MKKHLDFVYNIIHDIKSDNYTVRIFFNEEIIKFDEIMEHFYKQNKENKRIINRIKIFSKKRKLCNDIRNIIISFLITSPKIYSATNT